MGFPDGSDGKESACNAGDLVLILGSGRFPGEGNGYPLQYSCLENSMDRGTWQASVHGVAKCLTWLSNWHFDFVSVNASCVLSCVQLFETPWIVACQALLSMGFSSKNTLEGVAIPSSKGSSWPMDQTWVSCVCWIGRQILCHCAIWEAHWCIIDDNYLN